MDIKNKVYSMSILESIKSIISKATTDDVKTPEIVEIQFEDVSTTDGKILRIDKKEKGGKIQEMDTTGGLMDVEPGDYLIKDTGEVITVKEIGIIDNVSAPSPSDVTSESIQPIAAAAEVVESQIPEGEKPETEVEVEIEPTTEEFKCRLADVETEISDIKLAIEEIAKMCSEMMGKTKEFSDIKKKFNKEKDEMSAVIEKLQKEPAGNPIGIKASAIPESNNNFVEKDGYKWFKK